MASNESTQLQCEEAFSVIYRDGAWNQVEVNVKSGEGSSPTRNRNYMQLLQQFIRDKKVKSIVDLGCGDWSFSQNINWAGIDYTGMDVVPELIESHNKRFARPGIQFLHGSFVDCELPRADLAICKEALQHLPNQLVEKFLGKLNGFKYAILTNDRVKFEPRNWRKMWKLVETPAVPNSDIPIGGWRPLRLRDAPFNLPANELANIRMWHSNGIHIKEVLLWTNPML